jgi:hypothetical protein
VSNRDNPQACATTTGLPADLDDAEPDLVGLGERGQRGADLGEIGRAGVAEGEHDPGAVQERDQAGQLRDVGQPGRAQPGGGQRRQPGPAGQPTGSAGS